MTTGISIVEYLSWFTLFLVWLPGYFTNKITAKGPERISQIANAVLLIICFVLLFYPGAPGLGRQLTPRTAALELSGLALTLGGVAFAIWARQTLGRNWSDLVMTVKDDQELVQSGPYAIVRHPIYTGLLMGFLGTALTFGTEASYLAVVFGLVALMRRVNVEEKLMSGRFGAAHEVYRRKARKLVPFVW